MKLSEAILLGSVGTEQGFGPYQNSGGKACALKAAITACGHSKKHWAYAEQLWPWTKQIFSVDPVEGERRPVFDIVFILNDVHQWTRPQIAAWVASIEPQLEQETESCQNENLKKMPQTVQS
jgi:hypothetical protein